MKYSYIPEKSTAACVYRMTEILQVDAQDIWRKIGRLQRKFLRNVALPFFN